MPFSLGTYTRTKTFLNAGTVTVSDLNNIQDDIGKHTAYQNLSWKTHLMCTASVTDIVGGIPFFLTTTYDNGMPEPTPGFGSGGATFYLDPTDWTIGTRTTQMRLRASIINNAVTTGSITIDMRQIATWNVNSGVPTTVATFGATTITTSIGGLPINSRWSQVSAPVTAPAAGYFGIVLTGSAPPAGNSFTVLVSVQYRQL